MSTKATGGPAFPSTSWTNDGDFRGANDGMTLRDYFAAHAVQAICSMVATNTHQLYGYGPTVIAADAYEIADAMLAERAK